MIKKFKLYRKQAVIITALAVLATCCMWSPAKSETYIRSKVVQLTGNHRSCSGEQVKAPSGISYILTAGHCRSTAQGNNILVHTEDGRSLLRRIIAEDPASDLLLLEGVPNMEGLDIAKSAPPLIQVRTFTHGLGLPTYKTIGVLIGLSESKIPLGAIESPDQDEACATMPKFKVFEMFGMRICLLDVFETVTTASIVPGSSGGAVVDSSGDLVGVASATNEYFGYLVTLNDIHAFVDNY